MSKNIWNDETIKAAIDRFITEYGRPPKAREMDKSVYLPSARTIQREYGGLEKFREALGLTIIHFGKGSYRSSAGVLLNSRGKAAEREVRNMLEAKFGVMFVHVERPISNSSKQRFDFYVFSPSGNFAVDIFSPQDFDSMIRSINIKETLYKEYMDKLYLLVANHAIDQKAIDKFVRNKRNTLKENFCILTLEDFKLCMSSMLAYTVVS